MSLNTAVSSSDIVIVLDHPKGTITTRKVTKQDRKTYARCKSKIQLMSLISGPKVWRMVRVLRWDTELDIYVHPDGGPGSLLLASLQFDYLGRRTTLD